MGRQNKPPSLILTSIPELLSKHNADLVLVASKFKSDNYSGVDLIKCVKSNQSSKNLPVIICTIDGSDEDHINGLNQGADDYFKKSHPLELLFSKINALLRKSVKTNDSIIDRMNTYLFKDESLEVEHMGETHKLSKKEFTIFRTLAEHPERTFCQEELNRLTSGEVFISRRCIDTFVSLIRKKFGREVIVSIRKKGYQINNAIKSALDDLGI